MKFGLRAQLFLIALGLIAISVTVAYVYARSETQENARRRIEQDLIVRLELVMARAEVFPRPLSDTEEWDSLADRLGRVSEGRVTFIAKDGTVVGDSMVAQDQLLAAGNHRNRPEVQDALDGGIGITQRFSETTERGMLYVAKPLVVLGQEVGVARLALPTAEIDASLGALQEVLIVASLLALTVSVGVASLTVQVASSRMRSLTQAASRMAAGDLDVRTRVAGTGELAELGRALNRLARSQSQTLGALKEERDRLSGILSSMEEGVLFLDESHRVALVNPVLRDLLLLQDDPAGHPLLDVVRHEELKEMLDAAAEGEGDEHDGTVQGEIRVSGLRPRQLLVRAKKLEGLTAGVVAIFLDVTETRRLENLRREFVANVSHELRTPVTSIRSAAETLETAVSTSPEMSSKFLDIIQRNAERLNALVEDLLDLSRLESRQFSLSLEPIAPREILEHTVSLFAERAARRETEIVLEVSDELPEMRADRRALEHVVSNLLDNAVKYAGAGKQVRVRATKYRDSVCLEVADDGPGIPKKHLPRLFERFYRVDAGRSRDLGGTGLGLSIVKHLVESMSGQVSVSSTVGEGTTFRVQMPAVLRTSRRSPAA